MNEIMIIIFLETFQVSRKVFDYRFKVLGIMLKYILNFNKKKRLADCWVGPNPLMERYRRLFDLFIFKDKLVGEIESKYKLRGRCECLEVEA